MIVFRVLYRSAFSSFPCTRRELVFLRILVFLQLLCLVVGLWMGKRIVAAQQNLDLFLPSSLPFMCPSSLFSSGMKSVIIVKSKLPGACCVVARKVP